MNVITLRPVVVNLDAYRNLRATGANRSSREDCSPSVTRRVIPLPPRPAGPREAA